MKKSTLFLALLVISCLCGSKKIYASHGNTNDLVNAVVTCSIPAQPSVIAGNYTICNGTAQTYSVVNDPLATSYIWTLPSGWTGTSTTNSITATVGGGGVISVVASNTCGASPAQTVAITSMVISTSTITANCNQSNGSATVTPIGGIGPYTYTWTTGFNGPVLSNVVAGTYTITVKDASGCVMVSTATIPNASGPTVGISSFTNVSCFGGSNGIATTTTSGGQPGPGFPTYIWSNGQNTPTATNLLNGVYTVTLTDAAGCKASASVTIFQPAPLSLNITGINPKCFNATNGSANVGVLGGTPAYTYSWSPTPGVGGNTSSPSGMAPGNYNVTVTDSKGCVAQGSVALANPAQMLSSLTSTSVSCFNLCNGQAIPSFTNAIGTLSYTWFPTALTTPTVNTLCAGTYTMLAMDQNSCTSTTVFNITQPPALIIGISAVGSVSCSGGSNGFATAFANGGTPAYTYSWSSSQAAPTASNLVAGNYTVTVTDSKSCIASTVVTITQATGLTGSSSSTNVTCFSLNNGIGAITYTGGTSPYNILWTPSLNTNQNTGANLAPGMHTVTITDANGCILTKTISITQPPPITITTTAGITNCGQANGSATVVANGGVGGYTYLWSAGPTYTNAVMSNVVQGAYTITVKDANNCIQQGIAVISDIAGPSISVINTASANCYNGAPGGATVSASGGYGTLSYQWSYLAQTTQNVNNLPAGSYTVTVTDQANCSASATVVITQPSSPMSASFIAFNGVSCNGGNNGSASILASGGNPGYTYLWTPGAQTTSVLTNASGGNYTCTVTDANGCYVNNIINIFQPSALIASIGSVTNVACAGQLNGAAQILASGGTPGYNYFWLPTAQTNSVLTGVGSGVYTCSVTDVNGCVNTKTVSITQPNPLVITTNTVTNPTCNGFANGQIATSVSGGNPTYTLNWSPVTSTNYTINNLTAGSYSLAVFDAKGCVTFSVYTITQPPVLAVVATTTLASCDNVSGSAVIGIAGGTLPYSYNWNPSAQTTSTASNLAAGNYTVSITDANSCPLTHTITIPFLSSPTVSAISNASLICTGQTATLTASGANTYTWNTTATGPVIAVSPTITSTYTVSGTALNGCSSAYVVSQAVSPCTAIENKTFEESFVKAFPNPFSAEVTFVVEGFSENTTITIMNAVGQSVHQARLLQNISLINLSDLPAGIYIAEVATNTQKKLFKLIKD